MKIGVLGGGAWGMAIAIHLSDNIHRIDCWVRSSNVAHEISIYRKNTKYLGETVILPENIYCSTKLNDFVNHDMLFIVTPANTVSNIANELKNLNLNKDTIIVLCSKGVQNDKNSGFTLLETIVSNILPNNNIAFLSGPNFAFEVIQKHLFFVNIASKNKKTAIKIVNIFCNKQCHAEYIEDLVGLQIVAALKNVIAIAVGLCDGLKLSANFSSAIISLGLNEILKIIKKKGGSGTCLIEVGGVGDLCLTASCNLSRNRKFGLKLALDKEILKPDKTDLLVEGYHTLYAIIDFIKFNEIRLPLIETLFDVIDGKTSTLNFGETVLKKYSSLKNIEEIM